MPTYELALVLRQMSRPDIMSVVKRAAECILDRGGVIRSLNSLGTCALPYKISEHGLVHREGTYFNILFDVGPSKLVELKEEYGRDIDILRKRIYKLVEPEEFECTLHDELLPAAYRQDVQKLIDIAKKKQKPKFSYNSGLEYYPFQK